MDECISEIVPEDKLKNDPKLHEMVLKLKADTLQDIIKSLVLKQKKLIGSVSQAQPDQIKTMNY